jgi:hypothetical protein
LYAYLFPHNRSGNPPAQVQPETIADATPRAVMTFPSSTTRASETSPVNRRRRCISNGCVVAFLPRSRPAAPSASVPPHTAVRIVSGGSSRRACMNVWSAINSWTPFPPGINT